MNALKIVLSALILSVGVAACGSDADDLGVGGLCDAQNACPELEDFELACLPEFKGGYCGLKGCTKNADCPESSICVTHEGANYCFRTCTDKAECNENRGTDNESNCSSSITRVEEGNSKACIPPSA